MDTIFSAVIIAKNEEIIISKTITALLQVTDDVVIVLDDRSMDATNRIALDLGARVYHKSWEGYSANKNFGIDKAKNDWILCLDADEVLDDTLVLQLNQLKPDVSNVYEMNIQTYLGQYPVKYCGWFPDWNIRLFNKTVMRWNDSYVHEKLVSKNKLKHTRISGLIRHYSFNDEAHMISKFDYYAKLRANEWIKSGKKPPIIKQWFGPLFRFVRTYILKLGILDGKYGYIIAKNEYKLKLKELKYWKEMKGDA
ncbi:MAG: glycosyltransferase family 2 protein [Saprospiraceae bacterium]|nr:glycosyltransferase family 2 protein [Saprospiraceae bacterium]